MKILGINTSHNASICQITDGKIDFYLEEDRFNKIKNYCPHHSEKTEYLSIKPHANTFYDKVILSSFDRFLPFKENSQNWDDIINEDLLKQLNNFNSSYFSLRHHHLYHAYCGFYFSKFDEALCIVMDGGGTQPYKPGFQEIESVYFLTKKTNTCRYKHMTNSRFINRPFEPIEPEYDNVDGVDLQFSSKHSSGQQFSILTSQLGFGSGSEAGKTMGLASYGNKSGNKPEDEAKRLQISTKKDTIKLIKKAMSYNKCKNIVLSGGYSLNCVNNYEYVKEFPNYNFFVDPVAHDGGTAIGAALWAYQNG